MLIGTPNSEIRTFPIALDTEDSNRYISRGPGGNNCVFTLERPFTVPSEAKNVKTYIAEAKIWNTFPNLQTSLLYFKVSPTEPELKIEIPKGQYSLPVLNQRIQVLITAALEGDNLVYLKLGGNTALQKCTLEMPLKDFQVRFADNDLCRLLGFPANSIYKAAYNNQEFLATNVANFNLVNYLIVKSANLTPGGIPRNGCYDTNAGFVTINAPSGSQIQFEPKNIIKVSNQAIAGQTFQKIHVAITDQQNRLIDLQGENFSILFILEYTGPAISGFE